MSPLFQSITLKLETQYNSTEFLCLTSLSTNNFFHVLDQFKQIIGLNKRMADCGQIVAFTVFSPKQYV